MFSAVRTTYSLPSCSMMLPLRIELAMTFKAIFPEFLASAQCGHGVRGGQGGGFALQHTDFGRRCQRFTGVMGRPITPETAGIWRRLLTPGFGVIDRLGVVPGQI